MRGPSLLLLCLLLSACGGEEVSGDTTVSSDSAATWQTSAPAGPVIQHFSFTDEVLAVVEGAGCSYSTRGMTGDSSLFASSIDAVIRVSGKIQVLKAVGEGTHTDSTNETRFENASYGVGIRTVVDSAVEGGQAEHGEMTVEDKANGGMTTLEIVGGCGC